MPQSMWRLKPGSLPVFVRRFDICQHARTKLRQNSRAEVLAEQKAAQHVLEVSQPGLVLLGDDLERGPHKVPGRRAARREGEAVARVPRSRRIKPAMVAGPVQQPWVQLRRIKSFDHVDDDPRRHSRPGRLRRNRRPPDNARSSPGFGLRLFLRAGRSRDQPYDLAGFDEQTGQRLSGKPAAHRQESRDSPGP